MNGFQINEAILKLREQGASYSQIQNILHVGPNRISKVQKGEFIPQKMGRSPKLTGEIKEFIDVNTMLDARLSNAELSKMIESHFNVSVSHKTIANARTNLGYKYRPPMKIQELTNEQKEQRLQFAQFAKTNLLNEKIIFSDESRFSKGPDNRWVYVKRGKWSESAMMQSTKFSLSIMFWGAIGPGYKSELIVCTNKMDSEEYIEIINKSNLIQTCDLKYGQLGWCFMQDGATSHTSATTKEFLSGKVKIIPGWPPNSPDLNPIEIIWSIIKRRLNQYHIRTKEELIQRVKEVWNALDQSTIDRLVGEFNKRVDLVISVNGCSISQYISSHCNVPKNLPSEATSTNPFTPDEDNIILTKFSEIGPKWKAISTLLSCRSPNMVKNRFHFLISTSDFLKLSE